MNFLRASGALLLVSIAASAQLTQDQKVSDFMQLSAIFAKNYAPYEWKRDAIKFDLLDLQPWLDRIAQSKTDLDFYEIMSSYAASLQDASAQYVVPSDFTADLRFSVDIYDGKVLIDGIDRTALPSRTYPFQVGDEVVSVDGQTAADLVNAFSNYNTYSNPIARSRFGASLITFRTQQLMPHAHEIGDTAKVVILRQSGAMQTFDIPWLKQGMPLLGVGPVPSPHAVRNKLKAKFAAPSGSVYGTLNTAFATRDTTGFEGLKGTLFPGIGPLFGLPAGFKLRLGVGAADEIVTGTYKSGAYTLGFMRIPDLALSTNGQREVQSEVAYFQQNTDGLIIDIMGVPSTDFCVEQSLLTYLIPHSFGAIGQQVRGTQYWLASYDAALQSAKDAAAPQWQINLYTKYLNAVQEAYSERGGKTGILPFCGPSLSWNPATDSNGNVVAYTKPITVLTDEVSVGDIFAAILQDEGRAQIVGERTSGIGGGALEFDDAGNYSEGIVFVNVGSLIRNRLITTPEFPTTNLIENVGVRPDVKLDFQTKDNLLNNGQTFLNSATAAAVAWIQKNQ